MINLEMPEDVHTYIRQFQGNMKIVRKTGFYSQQQAIIAIIREHKEWMEKKSVPIEAQGPDENDS